jgi:hypothetical protein
MNTLGKSICIFVVGVAAPTWAQMPFPSLPRPSGPYEIRGVVVDAKTGEPLSEVDLTIQDSAQPSNPPFETIQTISNGTFHVVSLPEGKYTIRASRQGYAQQALLQHENFWTGVAVGPGKDSLHVRFPLNPSATITGQVTDENGEAVRGASVTLWSEQMQNGAQGITQGESVRTDDEGRYRLEHLLPGRYSLSVEAAPWFSRYTSNVPSAVYRFEPDRRNSRNEFTTGIPVMFGGGAAPSEDMRSSLPDVVYPTLYYPAARDWHGIEWMNLQAGQTESADFHLIAEASVRLRVRGEPAAGAPVANSHAALLTEVPGGGTVVVTARGTSEIEPGVEEFSGIPAGHYRVTWNPEGSDEGAVDQEIDVSGTSETQMTKRPQGRGLPIRGVIQTPAGEARIERAILQLKDAKGRTYTNLFYDPSGTEGNPPGNFVMENVPAGPQALEFLIVQPVDAVVKRIEAKGARVKGTTIESDGTQEVHLIVTVEEVSAVLEGAAMKNGKPLAGAMILLVPEDGKDLERRARRDQSDSDGTFRLAMVLPGKYALMALENGWEMEWSKTAVLKPYLVKAQKLEIANRSVPNLILEVQ